MILQWPEAMRLEIVISLLRFATHGVIDACGGALRRTAVGGPHPAGTYLDWRLRPPFIKALGGAPEPQRLTLSIRIDNREVSGASADGGPGLSPHDQWQGFHVSRSSTSEPRRIVVMSKWPNSLGRA